MKQLLFLLAFLGIGNLLQANSLDSIPMFFSKGIHKVSHLHYQFKEGQRVLSFDYWYPEDLEKKIVVKNAAFFDKTQFSNLLQIQGGTTMAKQKAEDIKRKIINEEDLGYPVLVFFTEIGLDKFFNDSLFKKLASNGYIVVAIDRKPLGIAAA